MAQTPGHPIPDWFQGESTTADNPTESLDACDTCWDEEVMTRLDQATKEVAAIQVRAGIDVPTDGELRRENYIHYLCRHLAPVLDEAALDAVSIEDAHRPSNLSLLELFQNTTVILGVIGIARTRRCVLKPVR